MKNNVFIKYTIIMLAMILLGSILQISAFLIPRDRISGHLSASAHQFADESVYYLGEKNTMIDTFTDAWMILIASYSGDENVVEKAFGSYYVDWTDIEDSIDSGTATIDALYASAYNKQGTEIGSYARYWGGYTFFLRFLLMGMNYRQIKLFNSYIIMGLACMLAWGLAKKSKSCLPLCMSMAAMGPISIMFGLSYASATMISLCACIALIYLVKPGDSKKAGLILYLAGIAMAYFDFLSFPIVSLGLPLTLYIVIFLPDKKLSDQIKDLFFMGLKWGIGYLVMWASKWILASIVLRRNIISEAFYSIYVRTSHSSENAVSDSKIGILTPVITIFKVLLTRPVILGLAFFVVIFVIYKLYTKSKFSLENKNKVILLALVSLIPFAWSLATSNHTYMHSKFTYRILAVSVFSLAYLADLLWVTGKTDDK